MRHLSRGYFGRIRLMETDDPAPRARADTPPPAPRPVTATDLAWLWTQVALAALAAQLRVLDPALLWMELEGPHARP